MEKKEVATDEKKPHWTYNVILIIGLPVLGFLCYKTYEHGALLGALPGIEGRLARIADALPSLQVQVASDELSRPIQAVLLASTPKEDSTGKWFANLQVYDAEKHLLTVYHVPLKGKEDLQYIYTAVGFANYGGSDAISFETAQDWSRIERNSFVIPTNIDKAGSLIVRSMSAEKLKAHLPYRMVEEKELKSSYQIMNTRYFFETLEAKATEFQPAPPKPPPTP